MRTLLLVEDDENQRASITALLGEEDVRIFAVGTAAAALEAVTGGRFDCAIIDLGLPDLGGAEMIEQIRASQDGEELPIIVYTGRELTPAEEQQLRHTASTIILKDTARPSGSSTRPPCSCTGPSAAPGPGTRSSSRAPTVRPCKAARSSWSTTTCATSSR